MVVMIAGVRASSKRLTEGALGMAAVSDVLPVSALLAVDHTSALALANGHRFLQRVTAAEIGATKKTIIRAAAVAMKWVTITISQRGGKVTSTPSVRNPATSVAPVDSLDLRIGQTHKGVVRVRMTYSVLTDALEDVPVPAPVQLPGSHVVIGRGMEHTPAGAVLLSMDSCHDLIASDAPPLSSVVRLQALWVAHTSTIPSTS